ncbi:N-acetylmuramoyl-L-alanine amidase [[Limnothrix rosea] IAM M-220]|uniref:hormogonium tapered terminus morphoprotein TftA n=1 Tax=[Limnothrix rosea] IAM M-220 TaxID=454133 RepID=UPI000965056F|nr:N-acetylmuramoyl-L-alanine amidase [[Limnothrix rosea] IAM M-220]OKH19576.1 cell wall hydrolase [[Limnothrix rosea] IAM M-220]
MGRIFISAGHGGMEGGLLDPGAVAGNTTEAQQMILLRDQLVPEIRRLKLEVLAVPDDLSAADTIRWINARARSGDIALELQTDAFTDPSVSGATAYYIANNSDRKDHANLLLKSLLRRVPELTSRGAKPDTQTGLGRLPFCREVMIPSLLLDVGFLTSPGDRRLLINRRKDFALGIAEGLAAWLQDLNGLVPNIPETTYPAINILINKQSYEEQGILINGNSYLPVDLVDRLGVNVLVQESLRLVQYQGIVYVKAIELRNFNVTVGWDKETRTLILSSIRAVCPGQLDRIMGVGNTSEVQMIVFLKNNNPSALQQFPELPKLYREEAAIEGVNADIAFAQMCLETSFLQFIGDVDASQNNFANLGSAGGGTAGATFPSARVGVRAHIQHLKAYASLEPVVQEIVDPRFRFVTRGIAPLIQQLSGRMSADLQYGDRLLAMVRRLYESAKLL